MDKYLIDDRLSKNRRSKSKKVEDKGGQENLEEILEEGGNAAFFAPGDPADLARVAHALLEDAPRLKRMSEAARKSIFERGFLWKENAARAVRMAVE